jgi:hypothetical protein
MAEDLEGSATPPEEGGNRMFLIGAILLGGIFIVALISIFALYFLTRPPAAPQPQNQTATVAAQANATLTAAAMGTQTRIAQALQTAAITPTPTQTPLPTQSPTTTPTPVVFVTIAIGSTTPIASPTPGGVGPLAASPTRTSAGATAVPATITKTKTPVGAPTALPQTGIGDSAGLPMLVILGGISMVVIILARQIRLGRARR